MSLLRKQTQFAEVLNLFTEARGDLEETEK